MKDVTGTRKAFELLLSNDYYWSLTGETKKKQWYYRSVLRSGSKPMTLDKMQELLELAGFSIQQETIWNIPQGS